LDVRVLLEALESPPWTGIDVLPQCASTNEEAAKRGRWRAVTTEHQVAGRGRMGRSWETPKHTSIAVSALVPTPPTPGWMPLVAGLAVQQSIEETTGIDARVKWPNDVLLPADRDRKVCGVLCELTPAGIVVGIGINVDQSRAELPVDTATSLRLAGCRVEREELLPAVLLRLAALHHDLAVGGARRAAAQAAYRAACSTIGSEVDLHRSPERVERVLALGVDDEARLVVDGGQGAYAVAAGDVVHVRPGGRVGERRGDTA
jgi:BirA family biotin operon repressor/biotin-[acetyl-CoA-carboxylase] ligase